MNPSVKRIGIDESNAIPGIAKVVTDLYWAGVEVHCAGLNQTSEQRPLLDKNETGFGFPHIIAIANERVRLYADCSHCERRGVAEFSYFKGTAKGEVKGDVLIGAAEMFDALCAPCYKKAMDL
jgi:thymidine kinase